jgi:hypothetical protein
LLFLQWVVVAPYPLVYAAKISSGRNPAREQKLILGQISVRKL